MEMKKGWIESDYIIYKTVDVCGENDSHKKAR